MYNFKPFTKTASLYDCIYKKRPYKEESRAVDQIIQSLNRGGRNLLDVGCGTGRHCIELSRLGYSPTGIDFSPHMLRVAKQNMKKAGCPFKIIQKDINIYRPRNPFDCAISLFHVLSYQRTDASVLGYFRAVHRALKPGGIFVFDCWYGPGVILLKPKKRSRDFTSRGSVFIQDKQPVWDVSHNIVHVYHAVYNRSVPKRVMHECHSMRYFFLPELKGFLTDAGFRLLAWGKLRFPVTPTQTPLWEICLVAQRT